MWKIITKGDIMIDTTKEYWDQGMFYSMPLNKKANYTIIYALPKTKYKKMRRLKWPRIYGIPPRSIIKANCYSHTLVQIVHHEGC